MRNFSKVYFCLFFLCSFISAYAKAQEQVFHAETSAQEIWDSNFSRTPAADAEKITVTSAGVSFDERFGRQRLVAIWHVSNYQHDELSDFDATLHEGQVRWNGQFGSDFNTEIEGLRNAHLADQWEFFEKDIVSRDDLKAKVGFGNDNRLTFHLGGRQTRQIHSNSLLEELNFDEKETYVDAGYQTANNSTLVLRIRSGNRFYVETPLDIFDFDFQQLELESTWKVSPKTSITATFAHVERKGVINDGSGELATINMQWEASPKLRLESGYSLSQPAVGETVDTPSKVQTYFISAHWQFTDKVNISSSGSYVKRYYEPIAKLNRIETLTVLAPFVITYEPNKSLNIILNTGWRDNQSPDISREYTSLQATLGIVLRY